VIMLVFPKLNQVVVTQPGCDLWCFVGCYWCFAPITPNKTYPA
jgi:hypothetical protein